MPTPTHSFVKCIEVLNKLLMGLIPFVRQQLESLCSEIVPFQCQLHTNSFPPWKCDAPKCFSTQFDFVTGKCRSKQRCSILPQQPTEKLGCSVLICDKCNQVCRGQRCRAR